MREGEQIFQPQTEKKDSPEESSIEGLKNSMEKLHTDYREQANLIDGYIGSDNWEKRILKAKSNEDLDTITNELQAVDWQASYYVWPGYRWNEPKYKSDYKDQSAQIGDILMMWYQGVIIRRGEIKKKLENRMTDLLAEQWFDQGEKNEAA